MSDEKEDKEEKTKVTAGLVFGYIFSILFAMGGLGLIESAPVSGVIVFLVSVSLVPAITRMVENSLGVEFSTGLKVIAWIFILVLFALSAPDPEETLPEESTDQPDDRSANSADGDDLEDQSGPSNQESDNSEKNSRNIALNETFIVDDLAYLVLDAYKTKQIGSEFMTESTSETFIVTTLAVENTGSESKNIFTPRLRIVDAQGRQFDSLPTSSMYLDETIGFGTQLQPGITEMGQEVFKVPEDAEGLKLEVRGDWLSTEEVLVDLEI